MWVDKRRCSKDLVISFNVVFVLTGCGAVAVGIWMIFDAGLLDAFFGIYKFLYPSALLLGAGLLTFFASFCGVWSAFKEHKCVLQVYMTFLIFIMFVEFVAGGLAFSYRTTVNAEITNHTLELITSKYGSGDRELDNAVDLLQEKYSCCGANEYTDYADSHWIKAFDNKTKYVPQSCCSTPSSCAIKTVQNLVHKKGCTKELYKVADKHYKILGGLGIAIGCLQFIGMFSTFFLHYVLQKGL